MAQTFNVEMLPQDVFTEITRYLDGFELSCLLIASTKNLHQRIFQAARVFECDYMKVPTLDVLRSLCTHHPSVHRKFGGTARLPPNFSRFPHLERIMLRTSSMYHYCKILDSSSDMTLAGNFIRELELEDSRGSITFWLDPVFRGRDESYLAVHGPDDPWLDIGGLLPSLQILRMHDPAWLITNRMRSIQGANFFAKLPRCLHSLCVQAYMVPHHIFLNALPKTLTSLASPQDCPMRYVDRLPNVPITVESFPPNLTSLEFPISSNAEGVAISLIPSITKLSCRSINGNVLSNQLVELSTTHYPEEMPPKLQKLIINREKYSPSKISASLDSLPSSMTWFEDSTSPALPLPIEFWDNPPPGLTYLAHSWVSSSPVEFCDRVPRTLKVLRLPHGSAFPINFCLLPSSLVDLQLNYTTNITKELFSALPHLRSLRAIYATLEEDNIQFVPTGMRKFELGSFDITGYYAQFDTSIYSADAENIKSCAWKAISALNIRQFAASEHHIRLRYLPSSASSYKNLDITLISPKNLPRGLTAITRPYFVPRGEVSELPPSLTCLNSDSDYLYAELHLAPPSLKSMKYGTISLPTHISYYKEGFSNNVASLYFPTHLHNAAMSKFKFDVHNIGFNMDITDDHFTLIGDHVTQLSFLEDTRANYKISSHCLSFFPSNLTALNIESFKVGRIVFENPNTLPQSLTEMTLFHVFTNPSLLKIPDSVTRLRLHNVDRYHLKYFQWSSNLEYMAFHQPRGKPINVAELPRTITDIYIEGEPKPLYRFGDACIAGLPPKLQTLEGPFQFTAKKIDELPVTLTKLVCRGGGLSAKKILDMIQKRRQDWKQEFISKSTSTTTTFGGNPQT